MYKQEGGNAESGAEQGAEGEENTADDEVTDVDFEEVEEEDKK